MATTARATNTEGLRTTIRTGAFEVLADEPAGLGGTDTGPSPYELLLASLAACTTMTVRLYANRKGWPLGKVDVELAYRKASAVEDRPRDVIERVLSIEGPLDDAQRARLVEIATRCPVSRTLANAVDLPARLAPQETP